MGARPGDRRVETWIEEELQEVQRCLRPPRRRVAVGLAAIIIAGTALGLQVACSPVWWWGAGGGLLLPMFLCIHRRRAVWPLMTALFLLMAAHARQSVVGSAGLSLASAMARPAEYVEFVAMALDDAIRRPARAGQTEDGIVMARVEGLNRDGSWTTAEDRIRIVLRGIPEGSRLPLYGERWRFRGVVRVQVPRQAGLFQLGQNQAVIDPDRAFYLDAGNGNPVKSWCMERRRRARSVLGRGLERYPEERGLLQALLLGYREDLPDALRRDFASTGTVHIFAISGAHVGMVSVLLAGLLRMVGIPLTMWFPVLTPLLMAYTLITGAATSAIRACVMASVLLAGPFLKRRPDVLSALAVAALAILMVSPGQLGDLGFLLSFTAVGSLLAIQPILDAAICRWFRKDQWALEEAQGTGEGCWRRGAKWLLRSGSVSLSAWVGTSPMTAYFFHLFSPVALPMNLVVIPAAFAILLTGVLSLAVAPWSGAGSEIFNHAAQVMARMLSGAIQWAADVPGGHWFVRTPPAAGLAAWYGIMVVASITARRRRGAMLAGLLLLAAMALAWGVHDARRCRVSVLNVGEGNAVLVKAQRFRILIDAGPVANAEETLRLLRREGVNRLNTLVLSHSDAQHIGAAVWLMQELPVGEIWLPAAMWPSPLMRAIETVSKTAGIPLRRVAAGDSGSWPGNMHWEVFWPPDKLEMKKADDASLAMRVARYGVSILLAGDLGGRQESSLARHRGEALASAVLVAGRHGDTEATSAEWLDAVRPRDIVISAGAHAEGRHPDQAVLDRLSTMEVRMWRTDLQGSEHIDVDDHAAQWPRRGYEIQTQW